MTPSKATAKLSAAPRDVKLLVAALYGAAATIAEEKRPATVKAAMQKIAADEKVQREKAKAAQARMKAKAAQASAKTKAKTAKPSVAASSGDSANRLSPSGDSGNRRTPQRPVRKATKAAATMPTNDMPTPPLAA